MKTALWAALVLAIEVLLLSGYFGILEMGYPIMTNAWRALVIGTVSLVIWLGYKNGFEQTLHRIVLAVVGCIIFTYVVLLADLPTAVVCERGRTEVEATPHIQGGRFEEYRVGPCVFFNPESKTVPGIRGSGGVGD